MLHLICAFSLSVSSTTLHAQDDYRLPPQDVVDIVDAAPTPSVSISPDGEWMLLTGWDALPSIQDLSRRMLRLAGTRIDPVANGPYRTSYGQALFLRPVGVDSPVRIPLPASGQLGSSSWSHDSRHFMYTVVTEAGTELWACTTGAPEQPRRLSARLNTVMNGPAWMPDGSHVVAYEVPPGRGAEPPARSVPPGPNVRETSGTSSPLRTYQDLLSNPYEEALFEHYATSQIVLLCLDHEGRIEVGPPGLYAGASVSPDAQHLLVTRIERPWSYLMPWYLFPQSIEVWSVTDPGRREHVVAHVPLGEGIPIGGVRSGPRRVDWKVGEDATLVWAEALDGGDPKQEAEHRDRWLRVSAPFTSEPQEFARLEQRATGLRYLSDPNLVITSEYDRDRRWTKSLLVDLSAPGAAPRVLEDRSVRDRYGDPGSIALVRDARGGRVVHEEGGWIYRTGSGASPEGLLPFLDRQNVETLEIERLWRCEAGAYESVAEVLGESESGEVIFVTRHETPTSPPNYRLREGELVIGLTSFPDPTPQIRGIKKQLVTYERADGVPLSATLYLPADYEEGTRLPLLVWAYPREFNDPATAGQVSSSPWRFTRISGLSHLALVTQGYAVMDGATMPVIGDAETMNDTFIEQIVGAAAAAIDKAAELGVADPERVAVGGHSYGAFMTANLLAHCDLFRAGVARSGAYNRTLTPFGFQSERRTIWEAPEVYFEISPFFHADEIGEPILLIHGEIDNNSGTFPIQSERLYQAIKGNGGTARLVMLPNESHGYRARESVLQVHAETIDWFDRHVKPAPETVPVEAGTKPR